MSPVRSWSRYWDGRRTRTSSGAPEVLYRKSQGLRSQGLKPTVPVEQVRAMHEDGVGPRRGGRSQGTHSALSYSPSVMPWTALRSPFMAGHSQHPEHTPLADPKPFSDLTLCESLLRKRPNLIRL